MIRVLKALNTVKVENEDQKVGVEIARRAMAYPLSQIVKNTGEQAAVVADRVLNHKDINYGYNASTGEYGDMIEMGILDPTKVARTALQNAASIASLMITTECMVTEAPKKKEEPMSGGGDMSGMGGGMGGMM